MRHLTWLSCTLMLGCASTMSTARAHDIDDYDLAESDDVAVGADLDVAVFDDALSPYGEWVFVAGLGRVWRPYTAVVGSDFRPYATGGRWVYTDVGWTFASTYSWGWAPFHYGNWWFDSMYGWVWLPGSRWAPAWVDWRHGGGYVGWAPVPPPGFSFGFVASWGSPWCFVETHYISRPYVTTYVVPVERVRTVYVETRATPVTVYGRSTYSVGPSAVDVSRATGRPVQPVRVSRVAQVRPPPSVRATSPRAVSVERSAPVRREPSTSVSVTPTRPDFGSRTESSRSEMRAAPAARAAPASPEVRTEMPTRRVEDNRARQIPVERTSPVMPGRNVEVNRSAAPSWGNQERRSAPQMDMRRSQPSNSVRSVPVARPTGGRR